MSKMVRLSQIVALSAGAKNKGKDILTAAYRILGKTTNFRGSSRIYIPDSESTEDKVPDIESRVEYSVAEVIRGTVDDLVRMVDIVATNDLGNCTSTVEVVIDGVSLGKLPIPFIIYMEKRLQDWKAMIDSVPTLDPAYKWTWDPNRNCYVSNPKETNRTKKRQVPVILAPATEHHPAQAQLVTDDVRIGVYQDVEYTTALPLPKKKALQDRVTNILAIFSNAREDANSTMVDQIKIGGIIYSYLTEGLEDN